MQTEIIYGRNIGELEAEVDEFTDDKIILDVQYELTGGVWQAIISYISLF